MTDLARMKYIGLMSAMTPTWKGVNGYIPTREQDEEEEAKYKNLLVTKLIIAEAHGNGVTSGYVDQV